MRLFHFPAFLLIIFGALHVVCASDDINGDLEALRKKMAAKEAERTQQSQGGPQPSVQIKLLQGLIARAEYDKAEQMLGNVGGYGMPPDFQEEWFQLVDALRKELETQRARSMEKWRGEVDQLVTDSKKGCLDAKNSADLDPLLLRCAALQMRREQQNNILGERTYRKVIGTAATLSAWANYLDFRDAGNIKRANETLRGLRTNDSQFPVLTASEIEARVLTDDTESLNVRTALVKVFEGVKTPDDLPAALERLKAYSTNPMNPELSSLRNEQKRLETVQQAWDAVKRGDDATALKALERISTSGGFDEAQGYYDLLKNQISSKAIQGKTQAWTKLTQNPDEDTASYLGRILDALQSKGDYTTMLEVMRFSDQINRSIQGASFARDRIALDQFLAAQRFESIGDALAAVTNYRLVVAAPAGKYIPTAQAQEALKKLQEMNPEVFKSYEGAIMEELRGLRQQIHILLGRSSGGRPYPPIPGQ